MQNRDVKDALSDAIIVIIDRKSDLAKKYRTTLRPSVFFIDTKTEKSVYTQVGYEKAGSFLISIINAKDNIDQE
jgi:thioredoxin-related protein